MLKIKVNSAFGEKWTYLSIFVSVESCFCLFSPNIQAEIGKHGSAIGCSADVYTNTQKI